MEVQKHGYIARSLFHLVPGILNPCRYLCLTLFLLSAFAALNCWHRSGDDSQLIQQELLYSAPHIKSDQQSYLRYQIVQIDLFLPDVDVETANDLQIDARGKIYHDGEQVLGVAGFSDFPLTYDRDQGCWRGRWAMPWNPALGEYQAIVTAHTPEGELELSTNFEIKGKAPSRKVTFPLSAVTLETDTRYSKIQFMQPDGSLGDWHGVIDWAEYMGADSVWYLTGMTKAMYDPTPDKPFREYNMDFAKMLGAYAHERGLKFGAWIGCYLPYGKTQPEIGVKFAKNYIDKGFINTLHFSLADQKRKRDIIDLVKWMDAQPEIDYIGFDYIRTGFGGYELVDEFIHDLNLAVPGNFWERSKEHRMLWLIAKLRNREPGWIELWQWWRASKVARLVAEFIQESGTDKPIFCFTLGWEMGHQHGQDVLMLNDAGVDFIALMLYEATRDEFDYMMTSWPKYISAGQTNLVLGNCLNKHLLENKWYPGQIQPQEYYDRSVTALKKLYPDGVPEGVFWHDLDRALSGMGGDFSVMEFALAGGASFSKLKEMKGFLPLGVHITDLRGLDSGGYALDVELVNHSSQELDNISLQIPKTIGVNPAEKEWSVGTLAAGETRNVTLKLSLEKKRYTLLIGVICTWGDKSRCERSFDITIKGMFKKPKEKEVEKPSQDSLDKENNSKEMTKDGF